MWFCCIVSLCYGSLKNVGLGLGEASFAGRGSSPADNSYGARSSCVVEVARVTVLGRVLKEKLSKVCFQPLCRSWDPSDWMTIYPRTKAG